MKKEESPFERRAYAYIERGYSVIPIAPGTKRPGQWSEKDAWRGMHDWERFNKRLPTDIELGHWYTWPGAGIGLLTGKMSCIVGLDRDWDAPGTDALERMIPYTPVKKKGAKGYTAFFRYNGERSCSFNIGGARVLDVLSDGRQTLMPGTLHPEGHTYHYLTHDILEDYDPDDLPMLPDDFLDQVAAVLAPYQDAADTKYQKKSVALPDDDKKINTDLSHQAEYFKDLNQTALRNLEQWVPRIVPLAVAHSDGYRTVATWRGAKNHNVGIHANGIVDWGGNYGMTPIDLVMHANGTSFQGAVDSLRACLPRSEPEPILMTVGGGAPVPVVPGRMPWHKQINAEPAPQVMLPPVTSFDPAPAVPSFIANPPGILGEVARWITATAPKRQPELAVAAAIALCSVIMGRTYRSQYGNYTSLFVIMVAKSTEGKEHPQACVEKILSQADLTSLIGGSGYTSAGGVYSALLKSPCHLVTIDEIGKLLKSSRANGNAHSEAAIDKLVEAFGRTGGVLRPPTYSTMTVKESAKPTERVVHQPAITMLGATTPGTFYANLSSDLVKDGFLGRCIVVESHQPRQLTSFVNQIDPHFKIIEWCQKVHASGAVPGNLAGVAMAEMPASLIELNFSDSCLGLMRRFEEELNDAKNSAESDGMDVLLGRTLEKAMRLAMICCKAESPDNKEIRPEHLEWAIAYVRHYDLAMVHSVRSNRSENEVDGQMNKVLEIIQSAKKMARVKVHAKIAHVLEAGAMPHSVLLRMMRMKAKDFTELMKTAVESGIVLKPVAITAGIDYGGEVYMVADAE